MSRRIVRYVELETFSHATESPEKVLEAALSLIPEELREKAKIKTQKLSGHYGNPITMFRIRVSGVGAQKTLERIASKMSQADKLQLRKELGRRLDRSMNLYLRLNKQAAYLGEARLADEDPIRVKVSLGGRLTSVEEVVSALEEIGLM